MALNNLRIIYQNWADLATVTASSTAGTTSVSNMLKDAKGLVWRSSNTTVASTTNKAILKVDLGTARAIRGVVLAFTNLNSATATMIVRGYSADPTLGGTVDTPTITGTAAYTSPTTNCCPWNNLNLPNWGTNPQNANIYAYGGGTYARIWLATAQTYRYWTIEITDNYTTSASGRYIEVSRLIMGDYWSPVYNTGYGMTNTVKDLSEHERTESGDLVSVRGPRFNALSFNLEWLDHSDRKEASRLMLGNGISKPILVSLFPDSTGDSSDYERERLHQIYGKFVQIPGISYQNALFYSMPLELEEV